MHPLRSPQKDLRERPLDGLLPTPMGDASLVDVGLKRTQEAGGRALTRGGETRC